MRKEKTRVLSIRMPESEYMWIEELATSINTRPSTLSKLMIDYFLMAHAVGMIKKPLPEVRKKFIETMNKIIEQSD